MIPKLEQFLIRTKEYISSAVAEMLTQELPVLTEEKFALFQTTGNRLIYEQDYFAKRKFLTVFGVAAQWMKQEQLENLGKCSKEAVLDKLEKTLVSVCEEECWALPAHVNPVDTDWRNTIDLFAAETAQTLVDIIDAVGADLSSQCVAMVKENVQRRVLQPFFASPVHTYGWEQCDNNWNAVCNGNIGSAYLHSLSSGEEPKAQYIERICGNLLHYMDGLASDGTCMEGLGYYFYGMTYMVNFAGELYDRTNGAKDLLRGTWGDFQAGAEDKRAHIAVWWSKCFFASGRTVSFSDGDSREKYRMGLACVLAERFEAVQLPNVKRAMMLEEDHCYRYLPFKMDLFCAMRYLEKLRQQEIGTQSLIQSSQTKSQQGRITVLQDAQWCIGEASLHEAGFACKGGHNDEPHNHNDVGSFLYVAGSDMFLVDLGAGEYTKEYFGEGRYNILCNRSMGHNVPLIAGQEQLTGKVYGCRGFEAIESATGIDITMNLSEAYEANALENFTRRLSFDKEDGTLTVEDVFESDGEIMITENLMTQFPPEVEGDSIILLGKSVCHIQILTGTKREQGLPRVLTMEHWNHQGQKEKVYLIQWDRVVRKQHRECFRIEVI